MVLVHILWQWVVEWTMCWPARCTAALWPLWLCCIMNRICYLLWPVQLTKAEYLLVHLMKLGSNDICLITICDFNENPKYLMQYRTSYCLFRINMYILYTYLPYLCVFYIQYILTSKINWKNSTFASNTNVSYEIFLHRWIFYLK